MRTKDEIRLEMREKRKTITKEERLEAGKEISRKLIESDISLVVRASCIALYLSTPHEIPTRYIARAIWEASREIAVPYWSKTNNKYKFTRMTPTSKRSPGKLGIREPRKRIPIAPLDIDAFIIPGLAFDAQGGRLGFGAGIYDEILSQSRKSAPKIALCYDWQVMDEPLPLETHDICMDWIVTDKRVIACKRKS